MRRIYKIEDEDYYVIWCDTVDMLMPNMFDSKEAAYLWLDLVYTNKELFKKFKAFQGVVTKEDMDSYNNDYTNKGD